ncbi:MAG: translation initiation factor IF-2 [Cyanobacteria bacterium P01_A01_bin.105]
MNNGRVRIYDISRELDLENKDILTICQRLNIAAKSHSSTITEEEAQQIRAAAPNVAKGNGSMPKRPQKPIKKANRSEAPRPKRPDKPRKPQILAVRRQSTATPPEHPQTPEPAPPTATPPAEPVIEASGGSADNLRKPPSRPSAAPPPARPAARLSPPVSPVAPRERDDSLEESGNSRGPAPTTLEAAPARKAPEPAPPKPKLARPVSRQSLQQRPAPARSPDGPKRPQIAITITDDVNARSSKPSLKPKPATPELRRPQPVRPNQPTESGQAGEESTESTTSAPELRRPTALRAPKRRPTTRSSGPDEVEEMPQKAKAPNKNKRRNQPRIDDDDDDFNPTDGGSGNSALPQVSLSLMRPAKPKSSGGASKAQPKPAAVKSRPISKGAQRAQRRERREESGPEKPEMIVLTGGLSVHELAQRIVVPETEIIKFLFFKGIATNINQTLDVPTAKMVAEEFEIVVETAEAESEAKKVTEMLDEADLENLVLRPPVVTIMGHVDHGKTSLLDAIRKAKVAQGEAGGITQHIGAYHVDVEHEDSTRQVVFLDTPGHEAFTAMRARGARVTDIAILVVAADDGVRPQTIEAISHAKAAQVPIVTAINKVDKETANPDRVKQELMEHGLVPEEWGGENIMVPVSAITGQNLDTLLEMILLQAEVEDLQANPDRLARGTVIEANLDKARGSVATLLIQNGTLRVGDSLVAGAVFGKVRAMIDDRNERVAEALPSFAVEVLGLSDVPQAGEEFAVFADEKEARSTADRRASEQRQSRLQQAMASRRVTLNSLSAQAQEGDLKELNLVLKADVQGSIEAILASLQQLPQNEVQIRVLMAAPGEISETDVDLAAASNAVIIGFNTTLAPGARQSADQLGVDIRDYDVIYKLLEDIEGAMEGLLEPEMVEEALGEVEVRAVFPVRKGAVAGCYVLSGKVTRNCRIRVMRGGDQVYQGNLDSLKRMRDDVKEVNFGFECGIGVDNFSAWKESDRIHAFKLVSKRRTLSG